MMNSEKRTDKQTQGRLPGGIPALSSIRIIRSSRRTLSLQVRPDGEVLVRAPRRATLQEIEAFIRKNEGWLRRHLEMVEKERAAAAASPVEKLTMDEIRELADRAMQVIPARAAHFAPLVGVSYGRITIRNPLPLLLPFPFFSLRKQLQCRL